MAGDVFGKRDALLTHTHTGKTVALHRVCVKCTEVREVLLSRWFAMNRSTYHDTSRAVVNL